MKGDAVSDYIRSSIPALIAEWERRVVVEVPEIARLSRPAVIDHLPELLNGLAHWVEGDQASARRGFAALAEGHALQRLGFGLRLEGIAAEYAILRDVVLTGLLAVEATAEVRATLIRLNRGMDEAIHTAVHRYTVEREQVRERFISILGHDLRNPLGAITTAAEILTMATDLPDRVTKLGTRVLRSSGRIQKMIDDLLGFAHGHFGGGIPVEPTLDDLGEICRVVVDEIRATHDDRTIELVVTGDLHGAFDRDRAMQALSNLVANAVQHGKDPVVVTARDDGPDAVITEVTNGGPPIPPEALPTLFDAFRQPGDTRSRGAGLGLGLYIVRQIALAHGATTDVSSTVEHGTRFTLRWPRTRSAPGGSGRTGD